MPWFLLAMTLVTDVVLVIIAIKSWRLTRSIGSRFARLQAALVCLLCTVGVVASIQDIGFQATQLGWLSESVGRLFVGKVQAALVVGGLFVLVPALWMLRQLTVEFATSEAVSGQLVNRLPDGVTVDTAGLTPREREVVAAIGAGHVSDAELAEELFVSSSTAATHVRNVMRKTGVKRRGDLALLTVDQADVRVPRTE